MVREELSAVDRGDVAHGLHLDDHFSLDEEVEPVAGIDQDLPIAHRKCPLPLYGKPTHPKFMLQTGLVG